MGYTNQLLKMYTFKSSRILISSDSPHGFWILIQGFETGMAWLHLLAGRAGTGQGPKVPATDQQNIAPTCTHMTHITHIHSYSHSWMHSDPFRCILNAIQMHLIFVDITYIH